LGEPAPTELLKAALEKIVFFEWRLGELAAELAAAQSRAASAEQERARAETSAREATQQAQAARMALADNDAERARLAALLARPAHAPRSDPAALEAAHDRAAALQAELAETRAQVGRLQSERERWLTEMIEQARSGGEAPAALAEFISELRGEVIALRERQKQCEDLLTRANMTVPPPLALHAPPKPLREPAPVESARALLAEGRLGGAAAELDRSAARVAIAELPGKPSAARALAEQCLRGLQSSEAARRAQAAQHLAAVPSAAAAPLLAHALGLESDARAKAALVRALVACGGEGSAELARGLLSDAHAIVRLAALEALASLGGDRAKAALEAGSRDPSAAVRRRAAALLIGSDEGDLLARLAQDSDESVRHAAAPIETAPLAEDSAVHDPVARNSIVHNQVVHGSVVRNPVVHNPIARDLQGEAILACRAAIFGLTEAELAHAISLPDHDAAQLAAQLIAAGRLARRGKRLVASGPTAEEVRP
jgi:hypothetical protein